MRIVVPKLKQNMRLFMPWRFRIRTTAFQDNPVLRGLAVASTPIHLTPEQVSATGIRPEYINNGRDYYRDIELPPGVVLRVLNYHHTIGWDHFSVILTIPKDKNDIQIPKGASKFEIPVEEFTPDVELID